jgi:serine/threonine protein kinase
MTPQDRWARIEELYKKARARPADEWPAFLREACPDDGALRDEVASLLAETPASEPSGGPDFAGPGAAAVPIATSLAPGVMLGHYRIESRLGAGGMGEVFSGIDTRLQRRVAIKVGQGAFTLRFRREAQALAALNHPHICTLYDVGADYLVMELLEGETLADRLLRGPLPLGDVLRLGTQITGALAEAHGKGITHRDLKPANVMLTRSGVKLLDFGLASRDDQSLTRTGAVLGTPAYMAPEQFQGRDAGPQTDIYALGLLLHEMATGKRPVLKPGEAPGLAVLPETLGHLVTRCLAEDPDARWRTASEIGALLEWFDRSREKAPAIADTNRRRFLIAGGGAAVIAGSGIGAWAGWTARAPNQPALSPEPGPESMKLARAQIAPPRDGSFVTADPNHGGMAVSPDGRWIAYVANVAGQIGLWVYPLEEREGEARRLLRTDASRPFWSPNSRWIGLRAGRDLVKVDVEGREVVPLASLGNGLGFRGGTWLPGDRIVFAGERGLFQVSDTGKGPPEPVTDPPPGESHSYPTGLEDDRVLYLASRSGTDADGIYELSLTSRESRLVLRSNANALYASGHLLSRSNSGALVARKFDPVTLKSDGEARIVAESVALDAGRMNASVSETGLLVFAASDERHSLRWLDREGNPLGTLGPTGRGNPRLSGDGRRAAFAAGSGLWLINEYGLSPLASRATNSPVFSPDGTSLIVSNNPKGSSNLFRMSVSGGTLDRATKEVDSGQFATDWSSTGLVLYTQTRKLGGAGLWVQRVNARGEPEDKSWPYLDPPDAFALWGTFSPEREPRWVAFQSDLREPETTVEVKVSSFPKPGKQYQVSRNGGSYPRWVKSGIYYVDRDGNMVRATPAFDGDEIRFSHEKLFRLENSDGGSRGPFFDVSQDGERFLTVHQEQPTEALTIVYNWPANLADR